MTAPAPTAVADALLHFRGGLPHAANPGDDGGGEPPILTTPGVTPVRTQQQQTNEPPFLLQPRLLAPALDSSITAGDDYNFDNLAHIGNFYSNDEEELDLHTLQNILCPADQSTTNSTNEWGGRKVH